MYVIRRVEDGKFVTEGEKSYTSDVLKAKTFLTHEAATHYGVCGNERVVAIVSLFKN